MAGTLDRLRILSLSSHVRADGTYDPPVHYEIETYAPYAAPRVITLDELPGLFSPDHEPIFSYGDGDEAVMIVSVHDEFSTVTLRHEDSDYLLAESSDWELVEIVLCGLEAWVPAGTLVRHETGLAALQMAHDVPRLLTEFVWRES